MGVHTGDSITVAPAQTLTDRSTSGCATACAGHPRDRRRHRRLQHPVRRRTRRPAGMVVIEMNPRVCRVSRRWPRRPPASPSPRSPPSSRVGYTLDEITQRHHPRRRRPRFEPTHRLRGGEDPALRLREVPGRRPHAHHADEVGGRGDGHRPHLPGGAAEGAALAGDRHAPAWTSPLEARRRRLRDARSWSASATRCSVPRAAAALLAGRGLPRGDLASRRSTRSPPSTPGSCARSEALVRARRRRSPVRGLRGDACRTLAAAVKAHRASPTSGWPRLARTHRGGRARARAQRDGAPARSSSGSTPAPPSSRRTRPTSTRPTRRRTRRRPTDRQKVMILGGGPNRIGQGIEFDYCCVHAVVRAARGRVRDRDGQLQPGDGLHRLRHLRPPLLRAAHPRGRAGDRRSARSPIGVIVQFGGQTPLQAGACRWRRRACPSSAPAPDAIDRAEDRERFAAAHREAGAAAAGERHRPQRRGGARGRAPHRLPGDGAALLRAGRPRHGDGLRRRGASSSYLHRGGAGVATSARC